MPGAWLLSSLVFGLAHVYQGVAGVIRATLVAIFTGQLMVPILLHALFDLQMLWMYRPANDDPDMAEKLMQGCTPSEL